MPKSSLSYPKVSVRNDGLYYIEFRLLNKRFRLFSGNKIGSSLSPNSYPARPHARHAGDTYRLPVKDKKLGVMEYTKQCFWLNSEYIGNIYKSI